MPAAELESDLLQAGNPDKAAFFMKRYRPRILGTDPGENRMNTVRACVTFQSGHEASAGSRALCPGIDHDRAFHRVRVPRS